MSIYNSEIDIVPCRQGFTGISTVQDFSEGAPVQVTENGSLALFKCLKDRNDMNGFWAHILEA